MNPNRADFRGQTPLHIAAGSSWADKAEILLEASAEPESVDRKGRRPRDLMSNNAPEQLVVLQAPADAPEESLHRRDPSNAVPWNDDEPSYGMWIPAVGLTWLDLEKSFRFIELSWRIWRNCVGIRVIENQPKHRLN